MLLSLMPSLILLLLLTSTLKYSSVLLLRTQMLERLLRRACSLS